MYFAEEHAWERLFAFFSLYHENGLWGRHFIRFCFPTVAFAFFRQGMAIFRMFRAKIPCLGVVLAVDFARARCYNAARIVCAGVGAAC